MKYLKLLFSLLVSILFIALGDPHIAQAEICNKAIPFCCIKGNPGKKQYIGKLPKIEKGFPTKYIPQSKIAEPEANIGQFIQIGINIAQGNATVDDYLLFAYANAIEENLPEARNSYSQALELAVKNKDIEGQAIARNNLGEVYLKMGNLKEAVSQLTLARDMYQSLGNEQRVGEVQQRLAEIEKPLQVNPSGSQIDPSQLQLDLSRIEL